jgi:hypothetical protein
MYIYLYIIVSPSYVRGLPAYLHLYLYYIYYGLSPPDNTKLHIPNMVLEPRAKFFGRAARPSFFLPYSCRRPPSSLLSAFSRFVGRGRPPFSFSLFVARPGHRCPDLIWIASCLLPGSGPSPLHSSRPLQLVFPAAAGRCRCRLPRRSPRPRASGIGCWPVSAGPVFHRPSLDRAAQSDLGSSCQAPPPPVGIHSSAAQNWSGPTGIGCRQSWFAGICR